MVSWGHFLVLCTAGLLELPGALPLGPPPGLCPGLTGELIALPPRQPATPGNEIQSLHVVLLAGYHFYPCPHDKFGSKFLEKRPAPGNHQKDRGWSIDVSLVLARPFKPKTILFRWMKIEAKQLEAMQLLFVQSMLNRSSDLSSRIKLAKFRLFIYSKLEPKINKIYRNLYISEKHRV